MQNDPLFDRIEHLEARILELVRTSDRHDHVIKDHESHIVSLRQVKHDVNGFLQSYEYRNKHLVDSMADMSKDVKELQSCVTELMNWKYTLMGAGAILGALATAVISKIL